MMPVYVFREGNSNIFKIGLTREADVGTRRRQLNSGSSAGLREFRVVHTEQPRELEAFLHRLLRHRNVERHGGKEFFEMLSSNHMNEVLNRAEPMFHRNRSALANVGEFEVSQCEGQFLPADRSDLMLVQELHELALRLRELEDEAAFVRFEKEMIECELKAKIGSRPGIEGLATWESKTTKFFCLEAFRESEPDRYLKVLQRFAALSVDDWRAQEPELYREITARHPKLDTTAWRLGDSGLYKQMQTTYFTPRVARKFILLA